MFYIAQYRVLCTIQKALHFLPGRPVKWYASSTTMENIHRFEVNARKYFVHKCQPLSRARYVSRKRSEL